jgi:hypothetical protein
MKFTRIPFKTELMAHKDLINFLDSMEEDYEAFGAGGPDIYLNRYQVVGEIKKYHNAFNDAINEMFLRSGGKYDPLKCKAMFVLTPKGFFVFPNINGKYQLDAPEVFKLDEPEVFLLYCRNNFKRLPWYWAL